MFSSLNLESNIMFINNYINLFSKIIIILYIIGFINSKSEIIIQIGLIFKTLFALYLIYRFNSDNINLKISINERKIIHSIGIYVLLISFADIIAFNINSIREYVSQYTSPIIKKIYEVFPFIITIEKDIINIQKNIIDYETSYNDKIKKFNKQIYTML